jgi:L-serine dehydratase
MERQSPSIFNDIVGPVMVGPSSSHTCAPSRIGFLARQLLEAPLKKCTVEFARDGAYTEMYRGQRSDMGFVNGLLGRRPEDPRLRSAFQDAKDAGVTVDFVIRDFPPKVPNLSRLILTDTAGNSITVLSDSTGGGTVNLLEIDGFETNIVGDSYELLIWLQCGSIPAESTTHRIAQFFPVNEGFYLAHDNHRHLINIKLRTAPDSEALCSLARLPFVTRVRYLEPVLSVLSNRKAKLPFRSAGELLSVAQETGQSLWELAQDYEAARSGWPQQQVWDTMGQVVDTMVSGVQEALKGEIDMAGILSPTAGKIETYCKTNPRAIDMGVLGTAVPWAMATMEYSSAMGVVHCAPTGGSAGVFPGAILGTAQHMGLSREETIKAMLVTSVLGIVMSRDCNYSAELYGCQVEPGAASAMAAGGLVYLMGGTPFQSCQAASCALQNILGNICDPVAGLVQLPCISRNAMATANALVSANMVMGGYDPLIPLDEAAETLFRVGRQLPGELRCTCRGGLCTTPSGQRLAKEQTLRDNQRG